jgi:plastocyanin
VTRISQSSPSANGTFDLVFNAQTYSSIPVDITASDLANRLQISSDFGYLSVTRTGYCTGYSYLIEWIANGGQKTDISIANASNVTPSGTTVTASVVQHGGVLYNPLPGDITRTYHTVPQVEVYVGGYPSLCSGNDTCDFQWLSSQTPSISTVTQNGMTLLIVGTGFSTTLTSNTVLIGTSALCTVTSATATSINCIIGNAPSGNYTVGVNVTDKGYASTSANFIITIPLQITSISPTEGGAGGGYTLTVNGTGFSSNAVVTVDGNSCSNSVITNFSVITCTVPATSAVSNTQVIVSVIDGISTTNAPSLFTYNVTNTPTVTSISSTVVSIAGDQLTIVGTLFGTSSISVLIGTTSATLVSSSNTQIVVTLPSLSPGIYTVYVLTASGYARPPMQIEYRFYVQSVSPQVGSLYGGTDVYVQGQGFDNSTTVNFTSDATDVPCTVISVQSIQIHCQTTAAAPQVSITSNGVDPTYGAGFAWSPQYATVQQGANVTWTWGSSTLLSSINYKVQQVANGYATQALTGGFDSGDASTSGSFSYQFLTTGTYYYWSTPVDLYGVITLRGVITVVAAEAQTLTVEVSSGSITGQSCVFPFNYNGINYTSCTTINDTQSWCSPSYSYTGQRLYCTSNSK